MTRLLDSIAGRIVGLLFAGLLLTMAASLSTYLLDLFHGKGWDETFRTLQRIAVIITILEPANPEARRAWVPILNEPQLEVHWEPHTTPPPLRHDGTTNHLARDLRVFARIDARQRVVAGYPLHHASATGWIKPPSVPVEVWVALPDHSWLRFVIAGTTIGGLWTVRVVLSAGLLAIGVAALGVWAARWVTAPLARFARAAERLGTDVDAPPLAEHGPREIRQAARAFNGMQSRLRRLLADRALMLGALSHDLGTVLSRLRLRTEAIADPDLRQKTEADLGAMEEMLQSSLSFARDDADAEPATWVDLAVLVQSLCDDLVDLGRSVRYEGPAHLRFHGRPVSLRRAIANLVDNALRYGGEAEVRLTPEDQTVELTVADRGPGIPASQCERVFLPFFRLEGSRSRETGGTGLGLTVARSVVRRHGGEVKLEDRRGGGLLVRVRLPCPKSGG